MANKNATSLSSDKRKLLESTFKKLNKKFGEGTVAFATEKDLSVKKLKTPSVAFNNMLYGGICKMVEFAGENSTGKTSMAIDVIKKCQDEDPDFVAGWFETEDSLFDKVLEAKGIDMNRLVYWDQSSLSAEEGFEVLRGMLESGALNLFVCNSIAGLCPQKEAEDDLKAAQMALTARLLSKLMRVITGVASKTKCVCIFINQTRENLGSYCGGKTTTGGNALKFYCSQRIFFYSQKLDSSDPYTEEEGKKIKCVVKKNRFNEGKNPYLSCTYYVSYEKNAIDNLATLPLDLLNSGILYQKNPHASIQLLTGNVLPNGEYEVYECNGVKYQWRSKKALAEALMQSPELAQYFINLLDNKVVNENFKKSDVVEMSAEEVELAKQEEDEINSTVSDEVKNEIAQTNS